MRRFHRKTSSEGSLLKRAPLFPHRWSGSLRETSKIGFSSGFGHFTTFSEVGWWLLFAVC